MEPTKDKQTSNLNEQTGLAGWLQPIQGKIIKPKLVYLQKLLNSLYPQTK